MANIAEILSNYPLGTQLYSPAFGRVRLKKIRPHLAVIVTDAQGDKWEILFGDVGKDLIDLLFSAIVKLKEEGVI